MYINVIRGTKQIGGNIIEIGTETTRLILDAGSNLPPIDDKDYKDDISVKGLTDTSEIEFDAVFISHHHGDHCGLLDRIDNSIPVYCGEKTQHHFKVIGDFINKPVTRKFMTLEDRKAILIGDMTVTPILTKHSASEAFMFYVEADGKAVLYSGDFNDYSNADDFLNGKQTNVLITEGTNICFENAEYKNEDDVSSAVEKICNDYEGTVFALCSTANEPRIRAISSAAKRSGRTAYEDLFMAVLRESDDSSKYKFVASYVKDGTPKTEYFQNLNSQRRLVGAANLAKWNGRKVLFVRQSMLPFIRKYINSCKSSEKNVLIYSMWSGYKNSIYTQKFLKGISSLGIDIVDIHCSGHAYNDTISGFINMVNADVIIPVHCDADRRDFFRDISCKCLMLDDGENYAV